MGKAQIELPRELYFAGEEIDGTVHFSLDKPVSERSATLYLVGKERTEVPFTTTAYVGKGTQTRKQTAVQESEFLRQDSQLPLPLDEKGKFKPGKYSIPFKFILPQNTPNTYVGRNAKILYGIFTKIDVPLGSDIKDSHEFDVISKSQTILSNPANTCSDSWNKSQSAGINVTLERCEYRCGEVLTGSCSFKNPDSKNLRKIDVALKWFETATALGHTATNEVMKTVAEVPVGGRLAKGENKFSIQIPQEAPQTFQTSLTNLKCMLAVSMDIALGSDVAASQAIRIVGRVGDESVVPSYAADRGTEAAKTIDSQGIAAEAGQRSGVYCHSCGAHLEHSDSNYCPFCGARITA
jgi:hypothetical protein